MKWFMSILAVFVVSGACGQSIEGPDNVELKTPAWYTVDGVAATASPLVLFSDVYSSDPARVKPGNILFWSPEPGKFEISVIVIDWAGKSAYQIRKVVTVGGGDPAPDPPDPDPPAPNPEAKYQILFFRQSKDNDELTLDQHELLSGLGFREELADRGHRFLGSLDVSPEARAKWPNVGETCTIDRFGRKICLPREATQSPPGIEKTWWDAVRGDPMPRVAIAPLDGGDIVDFPLPASKAAFWQLLEEQQ